MYVVLGKKIKMCTRNMRKLLITGNFTSIFIAVSFYGTKIYPQSDFRKASSLPVANNDCKLPVILGRSFSRHTLRS